MIKVWNMHAIDSQSFLESSWVVTQCPLLRVFSEVLLVAELYDVSRLASDMPCVLELTVSDRFTEVGNPIWRGFQIFIQIFVTEIFEIARYFFHGLLG